MEQQPTHARAPDSVPQRVNPYLVPEGQHGWRGLTVAGNHKRKWYTVLHNDTVLVTCLLILPGERSVRHFHESGELSVHFIGDLKPSVSWNPPGMLHGGVPPEQDIARAVAENLAEQEGATASDNPDIARLVTLITELQLQMGELQRELRERLRPEPAPRLLIDILFPPFKTTIDDPTVPGKKTVVGQWFD